MKRKILPRCPRCGSLDLSVTTISPALASWLIHQEVEPADVIDTSIEELTEIYSSMTEEEINVYYEDLLRPKPYTYITFNSAYTYVIQFSCRECDYKAFVEELGLAEWGSLLRLNIRGREEILGDFKVKVDIAIAGELKETYERRMQLYTTKNISELVEFLADPELSVIAKRRFDQISNDS